MNWSKRLRALIKQEASAADVEALLRGTSQIEDLRERIEEKRLEGELRHPGRPWETYAELGPALAYFWIAQAMVAIGRSLYEVAVDVGAGQPGSMPRVSQEQAVALLHQAAGYLTRANAALASFSTEEELSRPVPLRPRVEGRGACPGPHLKGMLRAAQYLDERAQVEVQAYCQAVEKAGAPDDVKQAAHRMQAELDKAQFGLRMAAQTVAPILKGEAVGEATHEEAENKLWASLHVYTWLGQVVAMPSLLDAGGLEPRASLDPARGYEQEAPRGHHHHDEYAYEHGHHHGHEGHGYGYDDHGHHEGYHGGHHEHGHHDSYHDEDHHHHH